MVTVDRENGAGTQLCRAHVPAPSDRETGEPPSPPECTTSGGRCGPTSMQSKALISVSQAAALLGVSRSVAYQWLRLGCLPGAVVIAGRAYVRRRVLEDWLAGREGVEA